MTESELFVPKDGTDREVGETLKEHCAWAARTSTTNISATRNSACRFAIDLPPSRATCHARRSEIRQMTSHSMHFSRLGPTGTLTSTYNLGWRAGRADL